MTDPNSPYTTGAAASIVAECGCFPHGPGEPCTCDGCWACTSQVIQSRLQQGYQLHKQSAHSAPDNTDGEQRG